MVKNKLSKIVSGGQTGVDQASLDLAIYLGIPHGGWCPKNRLSEIGPIPAKYNLIEAPTEEYKVRTEWNVRDSDGTLIVSPGELNGGTFYTFEMVQKYGKPYMIVDLNSAPRPLEFAVWLNTNNIKILNIAGPRASESEGIYQAANKILRMLLLFQSQDTDTDIQQR